MDENINGFQLQQQRETDDQHAVSEAAPLEESLQAQNVQTAQEENSKERNFRQLREKAERLERERNEAMRMVQSLQTQRQAPVDDDLGLADDDLVERKHVDKIVKQHIRQYEQKMHQYENSLAEQQVLAQCPDYRTVVTDENVDRLLAEEPEIAAALGSQTNTRSKAVATYNIIKKLGYTQPNTPYADDIARVQRNAAKPKPLASVSPQQGDSPLSRANAFANGLTTELQDELRKEMNAARRGY